MGSYIAVVSLETGDIVVDLHTKESGVLVRCVSLFEDPPSNKDNYPNINAWEILWSGSSLLSSAGRIQLYTEEGLINMIHEGLLRLYKNN